MAVEDTTRGVVVHKLEELLGFLRLLGRDDSVLEVSCASPYFHTASVGSGISPRDVQPLLQKHGFPEPRGVSGHEGAHDLFYALHEADRVFMLRIVYPLSE